MKAVILAAGLGSRLRPLTNSIPKCMVPVNGIRIIDRQISNLLANNINNIYVIAGYNAQVLTEHLRKTWPDINIITNSEYSRTNNMYSLFLASEYVKAQDFLLMNSDVYFDAEIIRGLLESEAPNAIACDKSQYLEESMKIMCDDGKISHISKKISCEDYYAVSIDVYKISAQASRILFSEIENIIITQCDRNSWTELALDKIFQFTNFQPYVIKGRWYEIDNLEDLHKAEEIFTGDIL